MRRIAVISVLVCLVLGVPALFVSAQDGGDMLAPEGTPKEIYFAAFPLTITLDGDLGDWAGVPTVTLPEDFSGEDPGMTFAVVADAEYLYFMADVVDRQGTHPGSSQFNRQRNAVQLGTNPGDLTCVVVGQGELRLDSTGSRFK